jgi:hypothetical protein
MRLDLETLDLVLTKLTEASLVVIDAAMTGRATPQARPSAILDGT